MTNHDPWPMTHHEPSTYLKWQSDSLRDGSKDPDLTANGSPIWMFFQSFLGSLALDFKIMSKCCETQLVHVGPMPQLSQNMSKVQSALRLAKFPDPSCNITQCSNKVKKDCFIKLRESKSFPKRSGSPRSSASINPWWCQLKDTSMER